ncbi:unnamed protein product, partial [Rotaria socialis]
IEQDDEFEYDTKSYSTTTNDSSALSAPPSQQPKSNNFVSHESNNIPASPICTTARKKCKIKSFIVFILNNVKSI